MLVYLRDGSTLTSVHAVTLPISSSHSVLIPDQPVPALTLQRQAPGRVATGVPMFQRTDIGLTSLGPGPIGPDAWQGIHGITNF